jgi:YfiH family protein
VSDPDLEILRSDVLARAGFIHGFATRRGGVSAAPFESLSFARGREPEEHVRENLERLARAIGFDPGALAEVSQVHGARVVRADGVAGGLLRREEADAVVVSSGAAGVRVADCAPVLVGNVDTGEAAAVHAGWRGVVAGVVAAATQALGAGRKVAAIGPSIGPCCFEVGVEVAGRIASASASERSVVVARRAGEKAFVDLPRAIRAQLRTAGLADDDIDASAAVCTKCDGLRFYSFRRDGEHSGRHLAVVVARASPGADLGSGGRP